LIHDFKISFFTSFQIFTMGDNFQNDTKKKCPILWDFLSSKKYCMNHYFFFLEDCKRRQHTRNLYLEGVLFLLFLVSHAWDPTLTRLKKWSFFIWWCDRLYPKLIDILKKITKEKISRIEKMPRCTINSEYIQIMYFWNCTKFLFFLLSKNFLRIYDGLKN